MAWNPDNWERRRPSLALEKIVAEEPPQASPSSFVWNSRTVWGLLLGHEVFKYDCHSRFPGLV
eukprot:1611197-Amphidinium_carterae.1